MHIKSIDAIEILDSRGVLQSIHVVLNSGHKGEAMVPSGASTGKRRRLNLEIMMRDLMERALKSDRKYKELNTACFIR